MATTVRIQLLGFIILIITNASIMSAASAAGHQCPREEISNRPKIGLVLGGGGARGYAHIGVIRKLEELRIPFDYIAGTSMGSIVGGFIATGMESDELTGIVRDADWNDLFKDKTERADLRFRRKEDDDLGLRGPTLGIGKDSSLLPKGVVSGQKIVFMFESVTSQRVNTSDFDQLPIPFRAIATDIVSGNMAIIGEGELSMAMRASMSVPAVFDPVHQVDALLANGDVLSTDAALQADDGQFRRGEALLVDGGLVRNLPVDVARYMGADVIIAVDVGTKLAGKEEMTSALAIVYQMSGLLTVHNTNTQIETLNSDDVLISPDIGDTVSSSDFGKLDEAIPIGYAAAEAMQEQLQKYSLSEADYRAWRQTIENCVSGPPQVHFVHLNNQSRFSDDVIRDLITIKPGEALDLDQLDHDLRQIYGLGFIRQARYSIIDQNGQQGLEISVFQDERGTQFIETGLDLVFSGRGTDFNIRGAYLNTALDDRGSEFRAMAQFGESPGLFADYFRPLDDGLKYSLRPSVALFRRPLLIFDENGDANAEIKLEELAGTLAIGREFGRIANLRAGYTRYAGKVKISIGNPDLSAFSFDGAELFANLNFDRLDSRYLPTKGWYSQLEYAHSSKQLGADESFDQIEFSLFGNKTFGLHNILWGLRYNTSFDDEIPIYAWYTGGGFLNMSGFEPNSLVGTHFGQIMTGYRYQMGKSGFLPGYAGMTLEYGNAAFKRDDVFSQGLLNGSVYVAYNSPLGPVYLGVGWSENRSAIYFLRLGSVFGPRALGRR